MGRLCFLGRLLTSPGLRSLALLVQALDASFWRVDISIRLQDYRNKRATVLWCPEGMLVQSTVSRGLSYMDFLSGITR